MKRHYILGITLCSSIAFLAFQKSGIEAVEKYLEKNGHNINAAGAPTGKTGAPGESSCAECHIGTTQDGTATNTLLLLDGGTPVSNYVPGTTYNATLTLNSSDVKEGFSATVLDISTNSMAGSFTGVNGFGTAVSSASGRDYVTHTATSNTSANFLWTWEWAAPATDVGPVKFYVATNIANGNNNITGDVIYLSEHIYGSTTGLNDQTMDFSDFKAGFAANENKVILNFNAVTVDNIFFNLVDMSGKSVFTSRLGNSQIGKNSTSVSLPVDLKSGIYMVNFFIGNKAMSDKIMIQK